VTFLDLDALGRVRTVEVTTTGRRSGRPVRIEIWWFRFEGRFVITGTPGPRDWLANVVADPRLTVHVDGLDVVATAATIVDGAFRRRFFSADATSWYREQVDLERLVVEAPMIEVTLTVPG
jgi:deazaflavin-dependent oxidoreductase (nitroreductase family)